MTNKPAEQLAGKSSTSETKPVTPAHVAPWGPVASILYGLGVAFIGGSILAGIIVTAILSMLGMTSQGITDWYSGAFGGLIYSLIGAVCTAGLIAWYIRIRKGSLSDIGLVAFKWRQLRTAIGGIIIYLIVYISAASVLQALVPAFNLDQKQELGFTTPQGSLQLTAIFVALVIIPPLIEELVFRGFIFSGFRRRFGIWMTAVMTSALFAVGHLQFGNGAPLLWSAATDTFILSMVMCYVRERTGSIVPTIIMHMLKNALAFYYLYVFKG